MVAIYFSGTGNSRYIAQQFASIMKADCHSIEEAIDFADLLNAADVIAVCYPIYGSGVPRIMREFVAKHTNGFEGKKLIIFCTQMMYSGDGAKAFARLLPGCDDRVIYAEHFSMPNNICNFFLFPVRDRERIRKKKAADRRLELVCHEIQDGVVKKRGWGMYSEILGKLQSVGFSKVEEKERGSFEADGDCIQCGLCVKCCPMDNITMDPNGMGQKNNCTLCYRCVNLCPQRAAAVMLRAKPKRQYKGMQI